MFVAMVTFSSTMLLWQLSQSTTSSCTTAYSHASHVLINHVIQLVKVAHFPDCKQKCGANSTCHSMNWYPDFGLCELNNATHLSTPEDFVPANHGNYLIYFPHPMAVCSNRWCKDSQTCLMYSDGMNSYQCHDCDDALGMEDGRINASQITASSMYDAHHAPSMARLHNRPLAPKRGAWSSSIVKAGEYLQIDLKRVLHISKVATQGRPAEYHQWVTKYALQYSLDGTNWSWIQRERNVRVCQSKEFYMWMFNSTRKPLTKLNYILLMLWIMGTSRVDKCDDKSSDPTTVDRMNAIVLMMVLLMMLIISRKVTSRTRIVEDAKSVLQEFLGNSDRDTVVTNILPTTVRTRYIRIVALSWNEHISMRAELYGCDGL